MHVDAVAELERVDDTEVFWDSAASYGATPVQAGDVSVLAAGPVTGVGTLVDVAGLAHRPVRRRCRRRPVGGGGVHRPRRRAGHRRGR